MCYFTNEQKVAIQSLINSKDWISEPNRSEFYASRGQLLTTA